MLEWGRKKGRRVHVFSAENIITTIYKLAIKCCVDNTYVDGVGDKRKSDRKGKPFSAEQIKPQIRTTSFTTPVANYCEREQLLMDKCTPRYYYHTMQEQ